MKKTIFAFLLATLLFTASAASAFNYQIFDFKYGFEYVMVKLPDGSIVEGKCEQWTDYESDAVQVRVNGVTYLTHYSNVVLISEK